MESKGLKFNDVDGMPKILEGDVIHVEWNRLFITKKWLGGGAYG